MDGGAWWAAVHGVARSQTRLSDFTLIFHFHALEKEMATHSSVLAWRIPGTGEPGGLQSMGSHRVGYDWSDLAAAANHINIRELGSIYPMRLFPEHFWGYVCIFQDSFTASAHPSSSKASFNTTCRWVVLPGLSLKYQGINKLWILIGAWIL